MNSLQAHHGILPNPSPSLKTLTTHSISTLKPSLPPPLTPKPHSIFTFPPTLLTLPLLLSHPLPSLAADTPDKINVEAIVVSIDDFFNRYPFFVAGVTFIWLVAIPLREEFLKKYKFIAPIDAFRKLRDDPGSQMVDIRKKQSVAYMGSPNLKVVGKTVVQLEFEEGGEDGFVKEVVKRFRDPGRTAVCVLDNFDGNSLKVAELLCKNGFKEAYAIRGGLRGKDGWQSIQEKLLPPSVHVYPRKKKRKSSVQPKLSKQALDDQNSETAEEKTKSQASIIP